jgi:UDP:flavonoid glycosyltransferase YjiC (YdhE family)
VFPRCAAVVHHGGAGTTHTALRTGCPSVVEHAFDQQFWGSELQRLGAAGEVLHRNTLTVDGLASAIQKTIHSDSIQRSAQALGQTMQYENGVQRAIELIEEKFHA